MEISLSDIREANNSFELISFCHIFHKLNIEFDSLSKESLALPIDFFIMYLWFCVLFILN